MASLDQLSDVFGQHRVADIQLLSKQLKFGFFQRHKQGAEFEPLWGVNDRVKSGIRHVWRTSAELQPAVRLADEKECDSGHRSCGNRSPRHVVGISEDDAAGEEREEDQDDKDESDNALRASCWEDCRRCA